MASYPLTWVQVLARLELVGLQVDDGDLPAAVAGFADVEELCRRELDGADGLGWLARTGVRLALAQDDLDGAGHWADRVVDPFWGPYAAAQVDLAAGRAADALERLTGAVARSHRQRVLAGLRGGGCRVRGRAPPDRGGGRGGGGRGRPRTATTTRP